MLAPLCDARNTLAQRLLSGERLAGHILLRQCSASCGFGLVSNQGQGLCALERISRVANEPRADTP